MKYFIVASVVAAWSVSALGQDFQMRKDPRANSLEVVQRHPVTAGQEASIEIVRSDLPALKQALISAIIANDRADDVSFANPRLYVDQQTEVARGQSEIAFAEDSNSPLSLTFTLAEKTN